MVSTENLKMKNVVELLLTETDGVNIEYARSIVPGDETTDEEVSSFIFSMISYLKLPDWVMLNYFEKLNLSTVFENNVIPLLVFEDSGKVSSLQDQVIEQVLKGETELFEALFEQENLYEEFHDGFLVGVLDQMADMSSRAPEESDEHYTISEFKKAINLLSQTVNANAEYYSIEFIKNNIDTIFKIGVILVVDTEGNFSESFYFDNIDKISYTELYHFASQFDMHEGHDHDDVWTNKEKYDMIKRILHYKLTKDITSV